MGAPNIQICASDVLVGVEAISAPNGGSRATAATSDCHGAQLAFQSADEPSADSVHGMSEWV
jgi:hypothetical protein